MVGFFVLVPAYILLAIPALATGLLPGLLVYSLASLFAAGPAAWIAGIIVGLMGFFLVLFSPVLLISGWLKVYASSAWTLAYRESGYNCAQFSQNRFKQRSNP